MAREHVALLAGLLASLTMTAFAAMAVGTYVPAWIEAWPNATLLLLCLVCIVLPMAAFWFTYDWIAD